jgi:DNA topoisomerase-2
VEKLAKKHKKANVKPAMVKNHLWVFVNSQIENPAFSSQVRVWAVQDGCGHC